MAATKRNASKPDDPRQAKTREAIQTTQLVKRLQNYALGIAEPNAKEGEGPAEIDSGRLKAIEILLRKSLPDLQSVTLETGPGGLVITTAERSAEF